MLTEICTYLHNWFDIDEYHKKLPHMRGHIYFEGGHYADLPFIAKKGQYFYIHGSIFNDGVYKYTDELELVDEDFVGVVQSMIIPKELLSLVAEIEEWSDKYNRVGSEALSPFNSESFGGYTYSKSAGGSGSGSSGSATDPISVFAKRLNKWRKL